MSVLQYPEKTTFNDLQIWDNAAFDNGESQNSTAMNFSWSTMNPMSINLSQSLESDSTKENQSPSMVEISPVSFKPSNPIKPLQSNTIISNTQTKSTSKLGSFDGQIQENVDLDSEIEKIEKEINRLSLRLESLRLEKAKRSLKVVEKRGRIVAAKFKDPPKQGIKLNEEQSKIEESMSMSGKMKTPRGLSLGRTEIMRGARRGVSLGPAEVYSATKLKQMGKQDSTTPVTNTSNRRKSCYWKLQDIDELRATKERGKSLSLSPKARSKSVQKSQPTKQAVTTIGSRKAVKKDDGVISTIQPKKLFVKDGEKSVQAKKPLKSGRVVASRYNQISNGGSLAMTELRKRSLNGNEEDCKRFDKKRVSLVEEQPGTETRVKKKWEIPSEVSHKTLLSVSKMLDMVPKIRTLRCMNESPRDSGPAKRVSKLVGRKSFFDMDDDEDEDDDNQALEYPKIRLLRCVDESPRDSGAAKRVSQLAGKKSFFDDDDEMPVFSFEEEEEEEN